MRRAFACALAATAVSLCAAAPARAEELDQVETWAALLGVYGHETETPETLPDDLDAADEPIVIVLDSGAMDRGVALRLRSYVENGGRLVIFPGAGTEEIATLAGPGIERGQGGGGEAQPLVPVDETLGVASVAVSGRDTFAGAGAALPILAVSGGAILLDLELGDGELLLLSDPSFVADDAIAEADNALMSIGLAGPGDGKATIAADLRRPPQESGIWALPDGWLIAALGLVLAALSLIWAKARRIGPVQQSERELPPPRREYLEAMAAVLARTSSRADAAEPIRREALRRLGRRTGLAPGATKQDILRAADQAGLDQSQAAALADGNNDEQAAIAAGSALAALMEVSVDGSG